MAQWHYSKIDSEKQGPVTSRQLKQLAISGRLQPDDLVYKERMAGRPAKLVKGLFSITPTDVATDQPSPLKKAIATFRGLKAPQKILVGGAAGMGMFFFLCMGMCGLLGVIGAFVGPQNSTSVTRTTPSGIQGRWWRGTPNTRFEAQVLIIDGTTITQINSNGFTTLRDYTVRDDVEPHQINIGWNKLDQELTPGKYNPLIERVNNETSYGIYEIGSAGGLVIRYETKGDQEYRPTSFAGSVDIGDNWSLALKPEYVHEDIWRRGNPPSGWEAGKENGLIMGNYKRTTDFK